MRARRGGAGLSRRRPSIVSRPPTGRHHQNFIASAPSSKTNPAPPGLNTTFPSGQSPVVKASFPYFPFFSLGTVTGQLKTLLQPLVWAAHSAPTFQGMDHLRLASVLVR